MLILTNSFNFKNHNILKLNVSIFPGVLAVSLISVSVCPVVSQVVLALLSLSLTAGPGVSQSVLTVLSMSVTVCPGVSQDFWMGSLGLL